MCTSVPVVCVYMRHETIPETRLRRMCAALCKSFLLRHGASEEFQTVPCHCNVMPVWFSTVCIFCSVNNLSTVIHRDDHVSKTYDVGVCCLVY